MEGVLNWDNILDGCKKRSIYATERFVLTSLFGKGLMVIAFCQVGPFVMGWRNEMFASPTTNADQPHPPHTLIDMNCLYHLVGIGCFEFPKEP